MHNIHFAVSHSFLKCVLSQVIGSWIFFQAQPCLYSIYWQPSLLWQGLLVTHFHFNHECELYAAMNISNKLIWWPCLHIWGQKGKGQLTLWQLMRASECWYIAYCQLPITFTRYHPTIIDTLFLDGSKQTKSTSLVIRGQHHFNVVTHHSESMYPA